MAFAFFIPIISFFLQFYPRLINTSFGVDVWTRLIEVDHLRKNGHKVPNEKISGQFLIDGYFDYPPLFPFLLSFFPKRLLERFQGVVSPFFDSLVVLLVYPVVMYLTGNVGLAVLAQVMYMLTPMIALENSYLTPRSFGYLFFTLSFLPSLLFFATQNIIWFGVALFFVTVLYLSHRFAIQSFVFLGCFLTFALNTPVFFQLIFLGFILAVVLTKGYYLRVLRGHLFNMYFWTQNLELRFAHQIRGIVKKQDKQDWVAQVYTLLSVFSPIALIGLNPWLGGVFVYIALRMMNLLPANTLLEVMCLSCGFFYVLSILVLKIKRLMPIGEGQRYLEMITLPAVVLSSVVFNSLIAMKNGQIFWVGLAALLVFNLAMIVWVQLNGVIRDKNRTLTKEMKQMFHHINSFKKTPRIVCFPHQNTTMTIYNTRAQVLVNADNPGLMNIQDVYPLLRLSVRQLASKYRLTHALVKTSFVTLKELNIPSKKVVFEAGDVKLVSLK